MLAHNLRLTTKALNARQLPQPPRPPIQDVGRACFGEEKDEKYQREPTKPHELPYRPCPPFSLSSETPYQWSEHRSTDSRNAPKGDPIRSLAWCEHVPYTCSPSRQYRTPNKTSQKTKAQQHSKAGRQRRRHLENDKDRQSPDIDWISTYLGYFAHGRPYHRSEAVAGNEKS